MFRVITPFVILEKRNIMSTTEKLTQKEKELVAVAASIASGCLPCTLHHTKAVREAGASEAEVLGATRIALDVRDHATEVMAEVAQGNPNYEYPGKAQSSSLEQPIDHLIAIGAALACNSVAGLEYYLTTARAAGASTRQIQTAIGIARSIRKSAAEKADDRVGSPIELIQDKAEVAEMEKESVPPPCGCS
jgi:AhpD family alkylhydroperoxidase